MDERVTASGPLLLWFNSVTIALLCNCASILLQPAWLCRGVRRGIFCKLHWTVTLLRCSARNLSCFLARSRKQTGTPRAFFFPGAKWQTHLITETNQFLHKRQAAVLVAKGVFRCSPAVVWAQPCFKISAFTSFTQSKLVK